jgi:hypothetical protein
MSRQYWLAPIPPFHNADGTALNTSTTLTDITPGTATTGVVIPSNTLEIGSEIQLHAYGFFSNTSTPTLLLGFYYGGVAGAALAASGAITTVTAAASWPWQLYYRGRVRAIGTSGSIVGQGTLKMPASLTQFQAEYAIPITSAARTVTIDTTAAKVVTVGAQWGTSSASNTITCQYMRLDIPT